MGEQRDCGNAKRKKMARYIHCYFNYNEGADLKTGKKANFS